MFLVSLSVFIRYRYYIAFTIVEAKLEQSWDKVVSTLFQHCFNVADRRCINVVQRWKSDVGFCFIFNVGSRLFQRWSTTLKQRWSDVEMLAGKVKERHWQTFNDMIKLLRILRLLKICIRISIGIALEVIALEKVSSYYIQIMSEYWNTKDSLMLFSTGSYEILLL